MLPTITPSQRQVVVELLDLGVDRETIAAQVGVSCGQGFAVESSPRQFGEYARPIELRASLEGVAINPLQLFPADVHDPVNVAQRVADTFQRVYPQIGVQQHAILRQAVLDVMIDVGITPESRTSQAADTSARPAGAQRRKLTYVM